jgi:hypothetical protein
MAEQTIPPPPPGFTLDQPQQAAGNVPPPPPGFTIDPAPPAASQEPQKKPWRASVLPISEGPDGKPRFDPSAGLIGDLASSLKSAVTLPGDVYAGRVDPTSDEAIRRSMDMAAIFGPQSVANRSNLVVQQRQPQVVNDAAQAGVNLTTGQRTGNPALLSREDAAFGGGLGTKAQEIAQAARARQTEELLTARGNIGEMAGRGIAQLERPADAGGIVADAVRANAAAARQGFKQGYDTAFSSAGSFKPEAFKGISGRIVENLTTKPEPVIIDDVLTPAANRALAQLDKIQNLKLGATGQPGAADAVVGVNLRGVDQARRQLVAFYKAAKTNPADARAVQGIIREFDDQIEQAVTKGLFEGDEKFLAALKEARGAYASYQKTFKPRGAGDDVGRILQTMVERDVTPEQVANYMFGSSKVGANSTNVRVAARLKELFGPESGGWAAIRQAAWQKLVTPPPGGPAMGSQKAASRIADFIEGEGRSFARTLFSPDEIAAMQRHANIERAIAAKPGTTNPSNSGNRLAGLLKESMGTIGGMLGMSTGGPQGAAAGYAAGRAAGGITDMRNAAEARRLFRGEMPGAPLARRLSGAAGAGAEWLAPPAAVDLLERQRRE